MKYFFTMLVCVMFGITSHAQWLPLGAPTSGNTSKIWSSGSNLYVLSKDLKSFYRSVDNGTSWTKLLDFNHPIGIRHELLIKGDSILISEDFNAFYRSIDAGNSWTSTYNNTQSLLFNVRGRILCIADSSISPYSIRKTDDWGQTWNAFDYSDFFETAQPFSFRFGVGDDKLYYLGIQNQLYVNVDSSDYSLVSSAPYQLVFFWAGGTAQAQTNNNVCIISRDEGLSWDTVADPHNQGLHLQTNFYFNNDTLFYIYPDSIYFQTNNNTVWYPVNGLPTGQGYADMVKHQGSYFVSSSEGGVYFSESLNGPWTQSTNFINFEKARVKEIVNNTTYISVNDESLATTSDNFTTFQALNYTVDGVPNITNFDFFNMDGTLFGVFNDTVVKSTDGGINWSKITSISVGITPINHFKLIHEGTTLYLSVYYPYQNSNNHFFLSSTDFGVTWNVIYGDLLSQNSWADGTFMKSGNYLYLTDGWNYNDVRKYSIINGNVQFVNTLAYQITPINWLKTVNNVLLGVHYQYTGNPDFMFQLHVSTDNGTTWLYGGDGLPAQYLQGEFYGNGAQMFAYIPNYGVYYSNNQGLNWATINNNVNQTSITSLNFVNNELYIYSKYDKFWKRTSPTGDIECASGYVYFDENNDNLFSSADIPLFNKLVNSTSNSNSVYSHLDGSYNLCVQDFVNDTIKATYYDPNVYFNPNYYVVNQSDTNFNFKIQFYTPSNDVKVDLTPMHEAILGFSNTYFITVSNVGSTPASGTVTLNFDNQLLLQSTSETPLSSTTTSLTWSFTNLYPTTQKSFTATFNFPISIPLASSLHFEALAQPTFSDDVLVNNLDSITQTIYSSYDPNDKTVNLSKYISPTQVSQKSEFVYTVRFQNTGNWTAQNVFIMDTISENLDLSTFHAIEASHNYNVVLLENRVVKFEFPNINLADSNSNEALSHGMIKYAICCNNSLQLADSIANTAHIFFDFNEPIKTNSVVNIVGTPIIIAENNRENNIAISPNPASSFTVIRFGENGVYNLEVITMDGRLVKSDKIIGNQYLLNTSELKSGVYIVKIASGSNVTCKKLLVQ